jgi:hypothetical protein
MSPIYRRVSLQGCSPLPFVLRLIRALRALEKRGRFPLI